MISSSSNGAIFEPKTAVNTHYEVSMGEKCDHSHPYVDKAKLQPCADQSEPIRLAHFRRGQHEPVRVPHMCEEEPQNGPQLPTATFKIIYLTPQDL